MRGEKVELTVDVDSLGTRHRAGDRGEVTGVHADGYLTVRMDDGRAQFPRAGEVDVVSDGT